MSDAVEQTCPVCGGSVRVVGKTTLHYERVSDEAVDNPVLDGTDAAHPAWWRGNDAGVIGVADRIRAALDGSDAGDGVLVWEELEQLRRDVLAMRERAEAAERRALALATALGRSLRLVQAYAWTGRKQDVVACPWCRESPDTIETHATDCEVAAVLADLTGQAALAERTELLQRAKEMEKALKEIADIGDHYVDSADAANAAMGLAMAALAAQPEEGAKDA